MRNDPILVIKKNNLSGYVTVTFFELMHTPLKNSFSISHELNLVWFNIRCME